MKKNKKNALEILVMVLVFGLIMAGCASPPNYFNLGNVSEENCAFVDVSSISNSSRQYAVVSFINIDGQGSYEEWKPPRIPFIGEGKSIVRITPGTHKFTAKYGVPGSEPRTTISVTYDCQAGKGYRCGFSDEGKAAQLTLFEYPINENGEFLFPKEVAKETKYFLDFN